MYTAKEVGDISLSGKDALVIIANAKELEGFGANEFLRAYFGMVDWPPTNIEEPPRLYKVSMVVRYQQSPMPRVLRV